MDERLQISGAFRAQFFRLDQPVFTPAATSPYKGLTFLSPPTAYTGDGKKVSPLDRKSTRLNSSHLVISYAVFCLKKKKIHKIVFYNNIFNIVIEPFTYCPRSMSLRFLRADRLQRAQGHSLTYRNRFASND